MKVLVIFALLVAVVLCERCKHDTECSLTSCPNGFDLRCSHDVCTCVSHCGSDHECGEKKDCEKEAVKHNCQCTEGMHCIDKNCYCGFPSSGNTTMV